MCDDEFSDFARARSRSAANGGDATDGLSLDASGALERRFVSASAEVTATGGRKPSCASTNGDSLFGRPLSYEGVAAVQQLVDHLREPPALRAEGLFRRQGAKGRIAELRRLICLGQSISLNAPSPFTGTHFSVDDVACCFKEFLIELPDPLCPRTHLPVYETIAKELHQVETSVWCMDTRRAAFARCTAAVRLLVQLLPVEHYELFDATMRLLADVALHKDCNKMDADNLAKLFVPVIFYPHSKDWDTILPHLDAMHRLLSVMICCTADVLRPPDALVRDLHQYCLRHPLQAAAGTPDTTSSAYWARSADSSDILSSGLGSATPNGTGRQQHRTPKSVRKSLLSVALGKSSANKDSPALSSLDSAALSVDDENSVVCCDSAASLADRRYSAKAAQSVDMDVELARLYAHVHAMPDGPLKQRMLKKFAKQQRMALSPSNESSGVKRSFFRNIFKKNH